MNFIVSEIMPESMRSILSDYGTVFSAAKLSLKDEEVAYHPDMQIHFVEDDFAVCTVELFDYYKGVLPDYIRLERGSSPLGVTYPQNCAYNVARVGDCVICNPATADAKIIEYYRSKGVNIVKVKQGYSKCNICQTGENSFLTEDVGIYKSAVEQCNLKVDYIPCGDVSLSGFEYGFIGGASGFFNGKTCFCGKVPPTLSKLLKSEGFDYMEISSDKLYDYGSILTF